MFYCIYSLSYSGSLATGLLFTGKKAGLHLEGGNKELYKLKNTVKSHMTLAGGQLHLETVQVRIPVYSPMKLC